MAKLRPATDTQAAHIDWAIERLRMAVADLKVADCPKTLAKVRAALKSAEGAQRHMRRRIGA